MTFDWSRWLEDWESADEIPADGKLDPQPDSQVRCPECAGPAAIGIASGGVLNVRCRHHGHWFALPPHGLDGPLTDRLPRPTRMSPEERLWMLSAACAEVLDDRRRGSYLIVEAREHDCEYLLIRRYDDDPVMEVSCREWDCPFCGNRPLPPDAVAALRSMGFCEGGPAYNPWRGGLPDDPTGLAVLAERALRVAYDLPADFEVVLYACDRAAYARMGRRLSGPRRI